MGGEVAGNGSPRDQYARLGSAPDRLQELGEVPSLSGPQVSLL